MSDQIQPGQNQDDELDVEELEQASGGGGAAIGDSVAPPSDDINGSGCNTNCPC